MSSANVCRWFAFAALCVVCTGFSLSASAAEGKKLALLVGVDKYRRGIGFRPLPYTERDVEQLAEMLIESGYRPEHVRVLTIKRGNEDTRFFPSVRNIRREFDLLAKGPEADGQFARRLVWPRGQTQGQRFHSRRLLLSDRRRHHRPRDPDLARRRSTPCSREPSGSESHAGRRLPERPD